MKLPGVFLRVVCAVVAAATFATPSRAQSPTLVFLVRHGEKAATPANDPPLTADGESRARALIDVIGGAGIGAVISTPYARTLATARPLAEKLGVKVDTVAIAGGTPAHVLAVADAVRKHAGKSVLVVGHSNTIPAIAAALGAPKLPDLCDGDYDQLFIVEIPAAGAARFTRARYGAPAVDAKCAAMK